MTKEIERPRPRRMPQKDLTPAQRYLLYKKRQLERGPVVPLTWDKRDEQIIAQADYDASAYVVDDARQFDMDEITVGDEDDHGDDLFDEDNHAVPLDDHYDSY